MTRLLVFGRLEMLVQSIPWQEQRARGKRRREGRTRRNDAGEERGEGKREGGKRGKRDKRGREKGVGKVREEKGYTT